MSGQIPEDELQEALHQVEVELRRAYEIHGDFQSMHEGYAVLLEEVDELWDEIKKRGAMRDREQLMNESKQVAAMGVKFLMFVL